MSDFKRPIISIVSPVYLCTGMVEELVRRIKQATVEIADDFEIVLIEDGSPDGSWIEIEKECKKDNRVKGVRLSRNFGQHFAISAGFAYARGETVVMMDCDLQDDPKYIPQLYQKLQEGYGIVYTKRSRRNYGFVKNIFSNIFYKTLSWISDFKLDPDIGNYTILSRTAVDAFLSFNDYIRGYLFVLRWLGFETAHIMVEHQERASGKSSYSITKLVGLALNMALSYSDKPLRISIYTGLIFSLMAFAGIVYFIWGFFSGNILPGWTSTIVMLSLIGGLLMIFLGVIGLYLSKVFEQTKHRPLYIVQETENI